MATLKEMHCHLCCSSYILKQLYVTYVTRYTRQRGSSTQSSMLTTSTLSIPMTTTLRRFSLLLKVFSPDGHINAAKTKLAQISRAHDTQWHSIPGFGTILGDHEKVAHRKHLANRAFSKFWKLCIRPRTVAADLRVRLYNMHILSILLYNCGTWALTEQELTQLASFHRR
uniref:Uncharacterized protein AlNc14C45G3688 n=1 Tax=Albugo laibachii Nc14 TaxID=890382 RepID=F0WAG1_9STRA|nr:hypothetical protein PITG_00382 [Albugo laibachii Nc14]|eukprot:CCA18132.1 hypothetical protein PITG_00382 [Albugo laibachii Nc14]